MIFTLTKKRRKFIISILVIVMMILMVRQNVQWIIKIVYPMHYHDLIEKYSIKYNIDPYLVAAIIKNESKFDPNAISRKEARGLMQIAPITGKWAAERLQIEDYTEERLFEPELNIQIGCWFLNILDKEFDGELPLIVAAYNAGNGNVRRWLENPEYSKDGETLDEIPFGETRIYLKRVLRDYERYKKIYKND